MIGIKVYDLQGDLHELFNEWRSLNFDSIFKDASLYSNPEFQELMKKNNMKTFMSYF